jgi:hypothetical protein
MYTTETGKRPSDVSTLPPHLVAVVEPCAPAKVRRTQTRKQPFSRTPAQAYAEDGVDTSVTVRRAC